jgi:hypothetical protein
VPDDDQAADEQTAARLQADEKIVRRWAIKVALTLAGLALTSSAVWFGTFIAESAQKAADAHFSTLMVQQVPVIGDQIYLRRVAFEDYAKLQIQQANESQLRIVEQEIVRIEGELQYGTLSEGRRAQLELQLQNLKQQREELERKVRS